VGLDNVVPLRRRDFVVAGKEAGHATILSEEVARSVQRLDRVHLANSVADGRGVGLHLFQSPQHRDVDVVGSAEAGAWRTALHGRQKSLHARRAVDVLGPGRVVDREHQKAIVHVVAHLLNATDQGLGLAQILAKARRQACVVLPVIGIEADGAAGLEGVEAGVQLGIESHDRRGGANVDAAAIDQGPIERVSPGFEGLGAVSACPGVLLDVGLTARGIFELFVGVARAFGLLVGLGIEDLHPGAAAGRAAIHVLELDRRIAFANAAAAFGDLSLHADAGQGLLGLEHGFDFHAAHLADLVVANAEGSGKRGRLARAGAFAQEGVAALVGAVGLLGPTGLGERRLSEQQGKKGDGKNDGSHAASMPRAHREEKTVQQKVAALRWRADLCQFSRVGIVSGSGRHLKLHGLRACWLGRWSPDLLAATLN
jgi:hypothetical protein